MSSAAVSLSRETQVNKSTPEENGARESAQAAARTLQIEQLAYALWIQRGSPEGSPEVDWTSAEQQLQQNPNATKAGGR